MRRSKFDSIKIGTLLGIVLPVITFFIIYKIQFDRFTLSSFFSKLVLMGTLPKLLSLTIIPNLLLFFIFIWQKFDYGARGVLTATFIDAFVIVILRYAL
ncbi:MAG: hypothetical protein ACOCYF_00230 [Bacteroidota bacterium]